MQIKIKSGYLGIDTVKVRVPYEGARLNTKYLQTVDQDGEVNTHLSNRIVLRGRDDTHKLHVRHDEKRRQLILEGSPNGYIYGQNVFSSPDLIMALFRVFKRMATRLNPPIFLPGDAIMRATLERIDIAVNLQFSDDEQAKGVVNQIALQFAAQPCSMFRFPSTTYWNPKRGQEYQWAFYAKGVEMRARKSKRKEDSLFFSKIVDESKGLLRAELRLRKAELRKLSLIEVSRWDPSTLGRIFCEYFDQLPIANVTWGTITQDEIDRFGLASARFLALHKSGAPIQKLFCSKTLSNHINAFKEAGLDVRCPNAPDEPIQLGNVLSDPSRLVRTPEWVTAARRAPRLKRARNA